MPVRRGHVAPQNLFIDTIIRRFDGPNRAFVVANAQHDCGVIFVNEGFCRMSGFSRADVMQRPCTCDFLHGAMTSSLAVQQLMDAMATAQERTVEILYYKKDGTKFLCQTTMCPIKNEDGDTCMFIVNFQDLTEKPEDEEEEASTPTDNTIQSRFNRARASFRQSFKMGSLRRGRSPASTSPGSRMEPILDHPAEEPQEEEQEEGPRASGSSTVHGPLHSLFTYVSIQPETKELRIRHEFPGAAEDLPRFRKTIPKFPPIIAIPPPPPDSPFPAPSIPIPSPSLLTISPSSHPTPPSRFPLPTLPPTPSSPLSSLFPLPHSPPTSPPPPPTLLLSFLVPYYLPPLPSLRPSPPPPPLPYAAVALTSSPAHPEASSRPFGAEGNPSQDEASEARTFGLSLGG
ncbi:putative potassium voltage-gated channel subfamily H member 6-like [Penaeus vannamei]|uniref:Putative potassium voltage-gated channel subfamily H member 6-like n=1 Tax=Penaeus vannamei TaxID=6689 RepID=A0A423TTC3_PENVA|nr:putative potassium voltage-gated channel subfamily H member 6-like [Penaeus vannamei]